MTKRVVDLRSDTVTRPSPAMRAAMAAADVGDDVFGEDPTVNRLQERAAELLGKPAALFVPSGSMANQIGLKVHCQPGDEVIVGEGAHNYWYESGAAGAIAGVQMAVVGRGGLFTAADVEAAYKADNSHHPPTRLVCVENTHNRGGGLVWSPHDVDAIAAVARARGLRMHLDGARLLNAVAACGVPAHRLAAPFDTATLCFSKGLGAPVGSVIAGNRDLMRRAHRFRKMMGGGMRQAGVLAAAALYALEHNVTRLPEDHAHARRLAERVAAVPGVALDPASVRTNLVIFDVRPPLPEASELVARLRAHGVLASAFGERKLRLVTHLDVDRAACEHAADVIDLVLRAP